jgi:hypothetical protein
MGATHFKERGFGDSLCNMTFTSVEGEMPLPNSRRTHHAGITNSMKEI